MVRIEPFEDRSFGDLLGLLFRLLDLLTCRSILGGRVLAHLDELGGEHVLGQGIITEERVPALASR